MEGGTFEGRHEIVSLGVKGGGSARNEKETGSLEKDLVAILLELREENKGKLERLREERCYTKFLEEEFEELARELRGKKQEEKVPEKKKLTALERLERKRFTASSVCSVESL